jgi:fermentation-respiration switch protein FrsA (DUF1100 family)
MGKISFANSNNRTITMSAVINFPDGFGEKKKYPAAVVSHPGGGVKEQTAGTYARKLAGHGFVTIAYDASYQGESTGEPRQLENPHIRTEDVSAVVDYLTTLPYVDRDRIGGMGVCAGAGYTANAAINDPRIKAVGTVSMVNIGQMFRNGFTRELRFEILRSFGVRDSAPRGRKAILRTVPPAWYPAVYPPASPLSRPKAPRSPEIRPSSERPRAETLGL